MHIHASWRVFLALALASVSFGAEKKQISPPGTNIAGPYSPGILAGDFLYVAGQGAKGANGQFPTTVDEQVRQCLDNVKAIVEAAGLTMDNVVYTQVYSPDPQSWAEIDKAWAKYFPKGGPARGALGVAKLPENTPVEINAVAIRNLADKKVFGKVQAADTGVPAAVLAGGRLFVSGVYGITPDGKVPEDHAEQAKVALDRMGEVLRSAGMDYANMVFVNPYLTNDLRSGAMNTTYAKYFEFGNTPARATIEAMYLPYGAKIEFTGVAIADLAKRKAIKPKNMRPSPTASPCVLADDTLYCSAKSAFLPGPGLGVIVGTVEQQVRLSMRNLLDGLEEAGFTFADVVASNVYLDDIADFAKMNRVYALYFPGMAPTRTTIQQVEPTKDRNPNAKDQYPEIEQISIIAVK